MTRTLRRGISRRPDGTYRVRRMIDGNRFERRAADLETAEAILDSLTRPNRPSTPPDRRMLFGTWLDRYIESRANRPRIEGGFAPSTIRTYRQLAANQLRPHRIWSTKMVALTRETCADALRTATKADGTPLSPTTVSMLRGLLTSALDAAIDAGVIETNPARGIETPRIRRASIVPLDGAELSALLEFMAVRGDKMLPMYSLAIHTGIRQGELLALRWSDIDGLDTTNRASMNIEATLDRELRRRGVTKTVASARRLTIPPRAILALREHRMRQADQARKLGARWSNPEGYVFTIPTGGPMYARFVVRHMNRVLRDSGVAARRLQRAPNAAPVRWHDLRHAYTSLMIERGVDIAVVSKLLGHKSIRTTVDVYGHLTDAARDAAADTIEAALRPVGEVM